MIKIISFIITIALCVGLTSCAKNISTDKEVQSDETNRPQNIPKDSTSNERIFLNIALEGKTATNGFEDSVKYGIYTSKSEEIFENMAQSIKKLSFNTDKEFTYQHSNCAPKFNGSKEYGTYYSVYDVYKYEKEEIEYLHGTDILCFYFSSEGCIENIVLTEHSKEGAKNAADSFLLKFLSPQELNEFGEVTVDDSSKICSYTVCYTKLIDGYKTDEQLWLFFDSEGNLKGYNGYNLKKYDALEDRITKEKLDAAKEALLDKLSSTEKLDFKHEEPKIITDTAGNVYLEILYSYRLEEGGAKNVECVAVSVN